MRSWVRFPSSPIFFLRKRILLVEFGLFLQKETTFNKQKVYENVFFRKLQSTNLSVWSPMPPLPLELEQHILLFADFRTFVTFVYSSKRLYMFVTSTDATAFVKSVMKNHRISSTVVDEAFGSAATATSEQQLSLCQKFIMYCSLRKPAIDFALKQIDFEQKCEKTKNNDGSSDLLIQVAMYGPQGVGRSSLLACYEVSGRQQQYWVQRLFTTTQQMFNSITNIHHNTTNIQHITNLL